MNRVVLMDNKELRKLGRKDLLEIILAQTKRIEELETELKKTNSELNSKKIAIEENMKLRCKKSMIGKKIKCLKK